VAKPDLDLDTSDPITKQLLEAYQYKQKYCAIENFFPDKGPKRRALYKKHMLHYKKGAKYFQRLMLAANQVGKTTAAGIELVYHLTGEYPSWWEGKVFHHPQDWWVCGKYTTTVREILQEKLIGPVGELGTGLIPLHALDQDSMTNAKKADTNITDIRIKHKSGGFSTVGFRSYDQGRKAFEGTVRSIWMDEEPPLDVYQECLTRTINKTKHGEDNILMMTFTPLEGMSETIFSFLGEEGDFKEGEKGPGKWVTRAEWPDVPHLDKKRQAELMASYPEYQREARTKGIPALGAGVVYPVSIERVFIPPFQIPDHFKRVFSLDFGFQDPTAILWGAIDPETDVLYIYAESYHAEKMPDFHAAIIKQHARLAGFTIPGVCDPSGGGSSTADGKQTKKIYLKEHGIQMMPAINSIEPGITAVLDFLGRDKIKIFETCTYTKREFQLYRRNDKGNPIGADHLMDALRYMVMSGRTRAKSMAMIRAAREAESRSYQGPTVPDYAAYGF
jgi:phage terminase large subunit-like protein